MVSPTVRSEHRSQGKALEWKPLGIDGCFEVDIDTLEQAITYTTEVPQDLGFDLNSYRYSEVAVQMALWLESEGI